jgi:restriction endonuclease S subunit
MLLGELVNINIGLTLDRKKTTMLTNKKFEYKLLTLKSFNFSNNIEQLPYEYFIANSVIGSQYLTKENDVIMRLRSPNQAIFINNNNIGLVVSSLMVIITNIYSNVLNNKYLAYYLNSNYIQNQLVKNTQGTAIPMIRTADIVNLEINLPPLHKQQQIINYIEIANQETELLTGIIAKKNQLKTEILETFIKNNKDI